jgi:hypothetical protein
MNRSLLPVSSSPSPFLCNYSWQQQQPHDDDNNGPISPSLLPLTLLPSQVSFFSIFFARLASLSPRHKRDTFSGQYCVFCGRLLRNPMPEEIYIKSIRGNVRNRTELRSRIRLDDLSQRSSLRLTASRVCVCVCVNFSNFCDTNLHKLYDIFLLFFFLASIFTRAFVSRVPQQFRQRSCWTCFLGPGSHHRGSPGLLLGHFSPRQTPDPCWYGIIDGRGGAGIRSCTEPLRV